MPGDGHVTLDLVIAKTWDAERLFDEYQSRKDLLQQLVGWLYPLVVRRELEAIAHMCEEQYACHPDYLVEKGHFIASWTDAHGVTHDLEKYCHVRMSTGVNALKSRDKPPKETTCLECITA